MSNLRIEQVKIKQIICCEWFAELLLGALKGSLSSRADRCHAGLLWNLPSPGPSNRNQAEMVSAGRYHLPEPTGFCTELVSAGSFLPLAKLAERITRSLFLAEPVGTVVHDPASTLLPPSLGCSEPASGESHFPWPHCAGPKWKQSFVDLASTESDLHSICI